MKIRSYALPLLLSLTALTALTGCAPLVVGGAMVGGALVATDRRTAGTQLEDEGIEVKATLRLKEQLGDRVHINANAYNRVLLLTGEVKEEADKARAEEIAARVDNVSRVVNELQYGFLSSLKSRAGDIAVKTKVLATLVDAQDLQSNAFQVVVERSEVYLMGRVTEREAHRAVELVRGIPGVAKVVKVFEILTEDELARLRPAKK
ncbi:osmotically-inducible protein OsmY [Inhella inkyongensis]|uniref:Osmotically-inducible protein OsmY n=1 Tax=Inhella inkyongensis TaxID=392593 RepID=A0A840S8A8_9BURK|nr:BON domain-containing protein [Inhella inkyongensis]MBB5204670.1 osmotically-inducible protein OsmY [Inhella inkyongensis]